MTVNILQLIKEKFNYLCGKSRTNTIFPAEQNQKVTPEPIDNRNLLQKLIDWDEEMWQKSYEKQRNRRFIRNKKRLKNLMNSDITEEEFNIKIERILDYAYDVYEDDILFEQIYKEYEITLRDVKVQTRLIPPIIHDDISIEEAHILSDNEDIDEVNITKV